MQIDEPKWNKDVFVKKMSLLNIIKAIGIINSIGMKYGAGISFIFYKFVKILLEEFLLISIYYVIKTLNYFLNILINNE